MPVAVPLRSNYLPDEIMQALSAVLPMPSYKKLDPRGEYVEIVRQYAEFLLLVLRMVVCSDWAGCARHLLLDVLTRDRWHVLLQIGVFPGRILFPGFHVATVSHRYSSSCPSRCTTIAIRCRPVASCTRSGV